MKINGKEVIKIKTLYPSGLNIRGYKCPHDNQWEGLYKNFNKKGRLTIITYAYHDEEEGESIRFKRF